MTSKLTRMVVVAIVLLTLSFQSLTLACGPFSMEAVFVYTVHPSYPLANYARGEIGVVQPSYARSYLYVAYRYLTNAPFTASEQRSLTELWTARLGNEIDTGSDAWVKSWLDARGKVAGVSQVESIDVYRNREKPNEYENYLNCRKDSFDTAVTTLNERIKKYGPDNAAIRTWIEGQDQVFANCSEGQHIPDSLPATADPLSQADRRYQIAAANFYSTRFDEAQKDFEAISTDSVSPWQIVAPYLVARTLIRKASLGPDENRDDSLAKAESKLKSILSDSKLSSTHAAAKRMLDLVRLRLHPADRLHELGHTLLTARDDTHLKQDLWDYTVLLDGILEPLDPAKASRSQDTLRADDLTDWITTLQGTKPEDVDHAVSLWKKTHSAPWLVAALSKVDAKGANVSELIKDALDVKPGSPAFASARFHAIRLLIETGKSDEARILLDQTLKNNRNQFDVSSLNLLLSARMMVATNLADFLNYAPRVPAALSWNDDGREIPAETSEIADENRKVIGKPLFDTDATKVLNEQLPLSLLKEAAMNTSLPAHLRQDLAQATWIRAVLLDDLKTADELVPVLRGLVPSLAGPLDDFARTTAADSKKFSALYTWLKFPGVEPIVDQGIGRDSPLNQQDSYRDNWWCGASVTPPEETVAEEEPEIPSFTSTTFQVPVFLTSTQRAAGKKEWTTLGNLGAMPNYLCKQVIQWASRNPNDRRVPEALHLAVNTTRHGCTDQDTGRWSKAAFDLLHRKYPNTTWAKKTKYWFKE